MRALVTGGAGRVGQWVAAELQRLGVDEILLPSRKEFDNLTEDQRWDVLLSQPLDILVHCAWITAHGDFWNSPDNARWQVASGRLFERFWAAGGRRIVGVGTCAEYQWPELAAPLNEGDICLPNTLYGKAKLATFMRLRELGGAYNRSYAWARVFFTFGPGESDSKLIPAMFRAQNSQTKMQCGHETVTRDFCDFESVGRMIARVACCDAVGPLNVGSGVGLSLAEIYEDVMQFCGGARVVAFSPQKENHQGYVVADTARLRALGAYDVDFDVRAKLRRYLEQLASKIPAQ